MTLVLKLNNEEVSLKVKYTIRVLAFCFVTLFVLGSSSSEAIVLVEHKKIKEKNHIEVYIPRIKDAENKVAQGKINSILSEWSLSSLSDYKTMIKEDEQDKVPSERIKYYTFLSDYRVTYNNKDIFSIILTGYTFTGGAHGSSWSNSLTANLTTGEIYKLSDLFVKDSDYKEVLDEKIRLQIDKSAEMKDVLDFKGVNENTNFYITKELLVVYFEEYEIGPYYVGKPSFYIFIEDIKDILIEDLRNKI